MNGRTARRPWLAVVGGLLLAAAMPPAVFPGAEFLVFAGLGAWFAIATGGTRPLWHSYVLGCVHMVCFSWSVHHALVSFLGPVGMVPAFLGIVGLGGLYFVLATMVVRRLPERFAAPGFAIASAASFWARANMPEICYPHGQPCHALWQWPKLLGSLCLGGETLANALLAGIAASAVLVWRSWRVGAPAWRRACAGFALAIGAAIAATVPGASGTFAPPLAKGRGTVSIAAVEYGLHCMDPFAGLARESWMEKRRALIAERLLTPTREVFTAPPDLVLWPESSLPYLLDADEIDSGGAIVRLPVWSGSLLLGVDVKGSAGVTPSALLVDLRNGRVLGRQDKQCLVPGGEFLPLLHLLRGSLREWVYGAMAPIFGSPADAVPGVFRPPLRLDDGTPFGALMCYDNAFPGPTSDQVAAGARFLCVLSNESWYRGGGELVQLVASTVCRAIESATPIVRCTTDGWSAAVGADGRLLADLPILPSPQPGPRILRVELPLGAGVLPPMAWLRAATGPAASLALVAAFLHALWRWARLRVARTAPSEGG